MGNLIIFFKIPPILKIEVGIFSDKKTFSQIFQNLANLFTLNFIFVNLKKNQRNFFGRAGGHSLSAASRLRLHWLRRRLSGEGSRRQVHPPSAQNVQDQSFKQKGLGAHGFSTERARLVVQVKKLRYAASRLIGALRFARGFKKVPITFQEFEPKFPFF